LIVFSSKFSDFKKNSAYFSTMKKALLIADSGGSKTDWCLIDQLGNRHYFQTASYHPHLMSDQWISQQAKNWLDYTRIYDLEVHFFGAGCLKDQNRKLVEKAFTTWNIERVNISSDLIGAAYSLLGDEDGVIGILGTGSVAAKIEGQSVKEVYGGFGYLLGDEGSGYAFGKKLLHNYIKDCFSIELSHSLKEILGEREEIIAEVYGPQGKQFIAGIAKSTHELSVFNEIVQIHEQNIVEFVEQYLQKIPELKDVSFVGSYAFHHQNILRKVLKMKGLQLHKVIERPIEELAEYFIRRTF